MEQKITAPSVNVNDEYVKLVEWTKTNGSYIKKGEHIFTIETTKATVEIEADFDGYLFYHNKIGSQTRVGEIIGVISDNENFNSSEYFEKNIFLNSKKVTTANIEGEIKWTLKAEKLVAQKSISKKEVEAYNAEKFLMNEELVNSYIDSLNKKSGFPNEDFQSFKIKSSEICDSKYSVNRQERVLILGGGGGGVLALDIISRNPNQRAVGILDNNPELHGKTIMGVDVIGGLDLIEKLWSDNYFDGAISTIVKDPFERAEIYNDLTGKGINFTNVISESVNIRLNVEIGKGNLIISGAYIAPCVKIGHNNFFAVSSVVEHHSNIGNHCLFGPRFTASGAVTIEDYCKFGMGVLIEPYVKIGQKSLVASGSVITNHIKENSIVRNLNTVKIVSKNEK